MINGKTQHISHCHYLLNKDKTKMEKLCEEKVATTTGSNWQ